MTTYRVIAPHFVAALVAQSDVVFQAAPILAWAVGKSFSNVRTYCSARGWHLEPLDDEAQPQWLEFDGLAYELHWNGNALMRVSVHEDGEARELSFDELPEQLKGLL